MNTYRIHFLGKIAGALGVRENFEEDVQAETAHQAEVALYDKYDHISVTSMRIIHNPALEAML